MGQYDDTATFDFRLMNMKMFDVCTARKNHVVISSMAQPVRRWAMTTLLVCGAPSKQNQSNSLCRIFCCQSIRSAFSWCSHRETFDCVCMRCYAAWCLPICAALSCIEYNYSSPFEQCCQCNKKKITNSAQKAINFKFTQRKWYQ